MCRGTSRIRIDKLFAVEKRLVFKNLGNLKSITFEKVKQEFSKLI